MRAKKCHVQGENVRSSNAKVVSRYNLKKNNKWSVTLPLGEVNAGGVLYHITFRAPLLRGQNYQIMLKNHDRLPDERLDHQRILCTVDFATTTTNTKGSYLSCCCCCCSGFSYSRKVMTDELMTK
jgi:hypothetical protein